MSLSTHLFPRLLPLAAVGQERATHASLDAMVGACGIGWGDAGSSHAVMFRMRRELRCRKTP